MNSMKMTMRTWSRCVTVALAGVVTLAICRAAFAIPTGSMGIRTFDADINQIAIEIRVERYAGPYTVEPIDIMTEEIGVLWFGLPAQTYAIYAIGNTGEPYPELPPIGIVTIPAGAHDLLVNLIAPPACPTDVDDDRKTGVADLLTVLAEWGACLGCPADTNDDTLVNVTDLLALLAEWGSCPE